MPTAPFEGAMPPGGTPIDGLYKGSSARKGYLFAGHCIFTFKRDAKFFSFFFFAKKVYKRGTFFVKKWYIKGKGVVLGVEPPRINIC